MSGSRVRSTFRPAVPLGIGLLTLSLASCSGGQSPAAVRTDAVTRATVSTGVSASGSLSAVGTENLGFAKGGKLVALRVKVGDHVRAGQVLARLDDFALRRALSQQKANLAAQEALLGRIAQSPGVSGTQDLLSQAEKIVDATRDQVKATRAADGVTIHRARRQLIDDKSARVQADDALRTVRSACRKGGGSGSASASLSALAERALTQIQTGDSAGAAQTLAQLSAALNSAAAAGDAASACSQVLTAASAVGAAKQKVIGSRTALAAAEQKKKVDAAAGQLSIRSSEQGVVTARNSANSASSDQPFTIQQQRALVTTAETLVRSARRDLHDATLRSPAGGTVTVINGTVGEYIAPSSGTSALAPGSKAVIPGSGSAGGSSAAAGGATATRPGGSQFMVVSGVDRLQVVLPFEESDAAQLAPGQSVSVSFDAVPDLITHGAVVSVAPSGTSISGVVSYYVTVRLGHADRRLKDGQTARGTVLTSERVNVLSVPNNALHRQGDASTVVVVESNGDQHTVTVTPGTVGRDRTEVRSGLSEGQRVVVPS